MVGKICSSSLVRYIGREAVIEQEDEMKKLLSKQKTKNLILKKVCYFTLSKNINKDASIKFVLLIHKCIITFLYHLEPIYNNISRNLFLSNYNVPIIGAKYSIHEFDLEIFTCIIKYANLSVCLLFNRLFQLVCIAYTNNKK